MHLSINWRGPTTFYHADHVSRRGFQDCRWAVPLDIHIHLLCAVFSVCGRAVVLCRCLLRVMRPCPHIRSGFNWARRTELCLSLPCSLNVWSITVTISVHWAIGSQGPVHCLSTHLFTCCWLSFFLFIDLTHCKCEWIVVRGSRGVYSYLAPDDVLFCKLYVDFQWNMNKNCIPLGMSWNFLRRNTFARNNTSHQAANISKLFTCTTRAERFITGCNLGSSFTLFSFMMCHVVCCLFLLFFLQVMF